MSTRPAAVVRRSLTIAVVASFLMAGGTLPAADAYPAPGRTSRVSVATGGVEVRGDSEEPSMTPDGRFVAFTSVSDDLVPGDTNGAQDVFVHDRFTLVTERVSVASSGEEGDFDSGAPSISADGRYVAFDSWATNLVPHDTNVRRDVFVHDRLNGDTRRISVGANGVQADESSDAPDLSDDGSTVAFESEATNLAAPDPDGDIADVFVHDLRTGATEQISRMPNGSGTPNGALGGLLSADGRMVAFTAADPLLPTDVNAIYDAYLVDRATGAVEQVSVANDGTGGNDRSGAQDISADGSDVAFWSLSTNLTPADQDVSFQSLDLFVRDRTRGVTELVSVSSAGVKANEMTTGGTISPDGRFVGFTSYATNLASPDNPTRGDVFVHDRVLGLTSRYSFGYNGQPTSDDATLPSLSAGGTAVAFQSGAMNLVKKDWNFSGDVFVREQGPPVGIGDLEATAEHGAIRVGGWARFAGIVVASADDPGNDGTVHPFAGAEIERASVASRPEERDVLLRIGLEAMPSKIVSPDDPDGLGVDFDTPPLVPEIVYGFDLTAGDTRFEVRAAYAEPDPGRGVRPAFTLHACAAVCEMVAALEGSIGLVGEEVRVAVPLEELGIGDGAQLDGVRAWSAAGSAETPVKGPILDDAALPDVVLGLPALELGVAPLGAPEAQVEYSPISATAGMFDAQLPTPGPGPHQVWARACLGDVCGSRSVEVTS